MLLCATGAQLISRSRASSLCRAGCVGVLLGIHVVSLPPPRRASCTDGIIAADTVYTTISFQVAAQLTEMGLRSQSEKPFSSLVLIPLLSLCPDDDCTTMTARWSVDSAADLPARLEHAAAPSLHSASPAHLSRMPACRRPASTNISRPPSPPPSAQSLSLLGRRRAKQSPDAAGASFCIASLCCSERAPPHPRRHKPHRLSLVVSSPRLTHKAGGPGRGAEVFVILPIFTSPQFMHVG